MDRSLREGTCFFLVGICGAGMSSLATLLQDMGMKVRGSDAVRDGPVADRLLLRGIPVMSEEAAAGELSRDEIVVYSSAIRRDNVVMMAALSRGADVLHRAELLAEIAADYFLMAVAGTHGKTTTSGMIGYVLAKQGFSPTMYVGGHILGGDIEFPVQRNQRRSIDGRPIMVMETDESDGSFLRFHPDVAVLTNIDRDHLGAYGDSMDNLVNAFGQFARQCSEREGLVIGFGDEEASARITRQAPRHIVYGEKTSDDVQLIYDSMSNSARVLAPNVNVAFHMTHGDEKSYLNAVAAALACERAGVPVIEGLHELETFPGMERRMQVLATYHGATVLTDHADHPTEIRATMQAVSVRYPGRPVTLILQPHRYSRVRTCLEDYGAAVRGASRVILLDIFPAGETIEHPEEWNARLRECLQNNVGRALSPRLAPEKLLENLRTSISNDDVFLFMGPGDVNRLASRFCALLKSDNAVESELVSPHGETRGQENQE
ncbi:MAG: Mur ligase family protein [Candidatus Cryosericum sp.]|nr:Mur ligase domain-containing protein [bacterium]